MSVARISEISAESPDSFDAAVKEGIERATSTLRGVSGAWIQDQEVKISDGRITGYQVTMKVTFILED